MVGISNTEIETNISQPGITRNKTKAEVIYDLVLAIMAGGETNNTQILTKANSMYNELLRSEIIWEIN